MVGVETLPFGDLLKQQRRAADLTQEELAERAGLSVRAISDLERGLKYRPRKDTVQLLIVAFELVGEERAAFESAARRIGQWPVAGEGLDPTSAITTAEALPPGVQTFLIADVRGYTRFTHEHGDEAAARLAVRFARLTREAVAARGGEVIELRGDEALAMFASARQALRAAVALQERFARAVEADPSLPLEVGIGLDAGEAIPVEGGYGGEALNLAARLCSLAGPGDVLTSEGVVHLARKMEGLEYTERGIVQLKGLADPVRVIEVLAERARMVGRGQAGTYRVQLLGPFALLRDESVIDTSRWQRRVGVLFRLLLVAPGKRRMREGVIELLWPDTSPEAGAGNLRLLAYRLRQALGNPDPPPIISDGDWITLNPVYHWEIDLDRFEELAAHGGEDVATLEEAARLVQEEPLSEDRYEDWAMPIRERIQRRWRDVCVRLAGLHRNQTAYQAAARWYERLLEVEPLDEEALQLLLDVLLERGKQTEALRRYQQFEALLAEELGVPPAPETLARVAQLRDRITQPAVQARAVEIEEHTERVPVIPAYPLSRTEPLVGREEVLTEMLATLPTSESHVAAPVRLVLLAAEAGMGKTRLLAEVVGRAREAGLLTLAGGCYEQEGKLPYGPMHDALLDYVRSQPKAVLQSQLGGLLPELARLLPELRMHFSDLEESPSADPENQRLRLFSTVAQVLERISQDRPLILVLDDLHWADDATLQLMHFLLRQQGFSRVLMIGAYRKEEVAPETPLAQLEAGAPGAAWAKLRTLTPLEEEDLTSLLNERVGGRCTEDLVESLQRRSGGNPFFALQMLQLLKQEGHLVQAAGAWRLTTDTTVELPPEVRELVARRLRNLGRDEREVLMLGAILGREFAYPAVEVVWSREEDALYVALDAAVGAQIMTETEEGYAFAHPLLHEVVYDRVPPGRRVRLHRKAGSTLESLYGEHAKDHATELARHFLKGGDSPRALRYSLLAGDQARVLWAHAEAEHHYRSALDLALTIRDPGHEAEALEKLGNALYDQTRHAEALEVLERAVQMYIRLGDVEGEGRTLARMGWVWVHHDREARARAIMRIRAALERRRQYGPSLGQLALLEVLATLLSSCGKHDETLDAVEQELELAQVVGDGVMAARALGRRGLALLRVGRREEALDTLERMIPMAEVAQDLETLVLALDDAASICMQEGISEKARRYADQSLEVSRRLGTPARIVRSAHMVAAVAYVYGDWERARRYWEQAAAIVRAIELPRAADLAAAPAVLRWQLGEGDLAVRELEACAAAGERTGDALMLAEANLWLAEVDLVEGRLEAVVDRLKPLLDHADLDLEHRRYILLLTLSRAYAERGDVMEARGVLNEVFALVRTEHDPMWLMEALPVEGKVLALQARWAEAELSFQNAVSLAQALAFPCAEASALHEWGRMFMQKGEREQARQRLEEALAIFQRLGARPYVERAERALAKLL